MTAPSGVTICSAPSAIFTDPNRPSTFVRSCGDNRPRYVSWDGSSWVWRDMGGSIVGDPIAVSDIENAQLHEIAAAQLAVVCQIE